MQKKFAMVMVTVLLIGVGFLGFAMAVQRGGGHGSRGFGGPEAFGEGAGTDFGGRGGGVSIPSQRILRRALDLTDEQIEEVNLLKAVVQAAVEPLVEACPAGAIKSCPGRRNFRCPAGGSTGHRRPRCQRRHPGCTGVFDRLL